MSRWEALFDSIPEDDAVLPDRTFPPDKTDITDKTSRPVGSPEGVLSVLSVLSEREVLSSSASAGRWDLDEPEVNAPAARSLNGHEWRCLLAWNTGVSALDPGTPPPGVTVERWGQLVEDALRLFDKWAVAALALGWDEAALFGLVRDLPGLPSPRAGLLPHVAGGRVTALTADGAMIRDADGCVRRVRRLRFTSWGTVAPWRLAAPATPVGGAP